MNCPRFIVASVTGAFIDPATWDSGRGRKDNMPTSYYVQDRAYCYRVIAAFEAGGPASGARGSDVARRQRAQARCDDLNRQETL